MRTRTVAFSRLAVGTTAMTAAGMVQSGRRRAPPYAASGSDPADERLVDVTSISIQSMSTIVHTPVRVKPPPAESGEIISPGCALRSTTTPPNGARIACLSSTAVLRCASSRAVSRCECDCRSCAVRTPTRAPSG